MHIMVHGGSLLKHMMYTAEDAVEQLPFTSQSPSHARQILVLGVGGSGKNK